MIQKDVSLKPFNTFGIDARAESFARFSSQEQLAGLIEDNGTRPLLILGGGSNMLITKNVAGLVLKNDIPGIEVLNASNGDVYVKCGAGENWHKFVQYCVSKNYGGIENLSLIPGQTGASPMQNIGAYGVEIKDVFHELEAWHIREKKLYTFSLSDCEFGYRESIFKSRYRNQFVILNVSFKLNTHPTFHIEYGAIRQELEKMEVQGLSVRAISEAVINIRTSKLPDPTKVGNAGSFFKNPLVSSEKFEELKAMHPDIPGYTGKDVVKLAAGWLIEQCGWKGYREGDAGCYPLQALVLVNYGSATGKEIFDLSSRIIHSVYERFGVELEREVNII